MTIRITHNEPQKLAHIAWCAIVALGIARKDKKVPYKKRVAANKFIGKWAGRAALDGRFGPQFRDELSIWESNGVKNAMISNLEASLEKILEQYAGKVEHAKKFPASYKRRIQNAGATLRKSWGSPLKFCRRRSVFLMIGTKAQRMPSIRTST